MAAQDCLYTLVVKHPDGTLEPRVIGSIVDYLFAPDDPEAVIERMADPATRIVSLTVTEGGYNVHPVTGEFDAVGRRTSHADLEPGAVPGTRVRARHRGAGPAARRAACRRSRSCPATTSRATATSPDDASPPSPRLQRRRSWPTGSQREVRFPNSHGRPDHARSPPTTTGRAGRAAFGVEDGWPVVCEPFTQWVLEDAFGDDRPPCEDVGVQLVDDVEPYELMKLRLLNASHQALCYFGYLAGYRYVHEVCAGPAVRRLPARPTWTHEATPTLPPVPGVDLDAYKHQLIERFANPEVRDTVARLCAESSDRIPKWLLPVVREQPRGRARGRPSAAVVAELGPLRRGRRRAGRADRGRRPAARHAHGRGRAARPRTRWPSSADRDAVRRPRRRASASSSAYRWALDSLHARRRPRDARGAALGGAGA